MSLPPDNASSGIPTPPLSQPTGNSGSTKPPPSSSSGVTSVDTTRATPPPPLQSSGQPRGVPVTGRTAGNQPPVSTVNEAARINTLKNSYAKQWHTVQAMRAQDHLLTNLDAIIQCLNSPETAPADLPFRIIHIDETGKMAPLSSPGSGLPDQKAKTDAARKQVIESLKAIDKAFGRTETQAFKDELRSAEAALMGFGSQLIAAGVTTPPPVPRGFVPVSIVDFLQTRVPDKAPPQPPVPAPKPSATPVNNNFQYHGLPAHKPEPGEPILPVSDDVPPVTPTAHPPLLNPEPQPVKPSGARPKQPTNEDDPLPLNPKNNYEKPVSERKNPTRVPPYLVELDKYKVFTDDTRKLEHIAYDAPVILEATTQFEQSSAPSVEKSHLTRRALAFGLLMNLHKTTGHDEAWYISPDIIQLIQRGMLYTGVTEDDLLWQQPDAQAKKKCLAFLLQGELATPPVAAFVASIVAGTAHKDSLPAKVMRDAIRLEEMRNMDQFDINALESYYSDAVDAEIQRPTITRFCEQWRALLAKEGELYKPAALINRAESERKIYPEYKAEDNTALRERYERSGNPFAEHVELINTDPHLGFLNLFTEKLSG